MEPASNELRLNKHLDLVFIFCFIFLYLWLYFVLLVIFCAFANSTGSDSSVGRSSALRLKVAELAMRRCVLGKDALSCLGCFGFALGCFLFRPSSLPLW